MARRRRWGFTQWLLSLLTSLLVLTVYGIPLGPGQLSHAAEGGAAPASPEQLGTARKLSEAFNRTAKALRPSVVSISSVQRVQRGQPQMRDFGGQEMPDELRRFFGDDFFERFNQPAPRGGFQRQGAGSGVIVSQEGYILTNNHVVEGADEVTVRLSDDREFQAEVVGTDKPTDLAVLKIDAKNLVPAKLGDSSEMEVGDWVLAIGSPFRLDQTVTAGIVSATGRANVGIADYEDFIQTDAAVNPGNSGGPLVNLMGEVVGINTAIASRTGGNLGVSFAIPSSMAKSVMEALIDQGRVERGYLGAMIQNLNEDLAESFGYEGTQGVLIGDVIEGGPAAEAGLQSGDIVVQFNGRRMSDANELRNAVAAVKAGTEAEVRIFRDGQEKVVTVEVGQLEGSPLASSTPESAQDTLGIGIAVQALTADKAAELGIDNGVLVTEVEPGSAAASAGIRTNDVIVSVGREKIQGVADFRKILQEQDLEKGIRMQVVSEGVRRFVFLKAQP